MNARTTASPWRCLGVALAGTGALGGLVVVVAPDLAAASAALTGADLAARPFTDLLEWLCAATALAVATWLWAGTVAVAASAAGMRARRGPAPRGGGLPAPVRRLVLLACGAALTGGLALPAQATSAHPHAEHDRAGTTALLDGLPLPERATGAGPRPPSAARPALRLAPAHRSGSVVVHPGDTLWDLATEALPGPTDDPTVAARWQRIYARNRAVVGADPDLIRPGERLRLPRA